MRLGRVLPPWWNDKPIAVVGTGPSLINVDLERLRGHCHVLAVKAAIFDLQWADCGFGIDRPRYQEWVDRLAEVPMTVYWAVDPTREVPQPGNVIFLRRDNNQMFCPDDDRICGGASSGYAALHMAMHKRPGRQPIYLFGYDYGAGTKIDGNRPWHVNERHYRRPRSHSPRNWKVWAENFTNLAMVLREQRISVFNASPDSLIGAFPKMTPEEAIGRIIDAG